MRGHHDPIAWAATMLIAVAYAHVLFELAAAVLVVAVAVRLLVSPARGGLREPARRALDHRNRVKVVDRPSVNGLDDGPGGPLS
jgi:hypothetical protein